MLPSQSLGGRDMGMWLCLSQAFPPTRGFESGAGDPEKQGQGRMHLGDGTCRIKFPEATVWQSELGTEDLGGRSHMTGSLA